MNKVIIVQDNISVRVVSHDEAVPLSNTIFEAVRGIEDSNYAAIVLSGALATAIENLDRTLWSNKVQTITNDLYEQLQRLVEAVQSDEGLDSGDYDDEDDYPGNKFSVN